MRLGEVHRAGPFAGDHLRQIGGFLLRRAVRKQRRDRPLRQPRIHGEGHVGRAQELVDDLRHDRRQALAAEFERRRYSDPAAFDQLPEGVLKARRRGHAAVGRAFAAFLVADAIERRQHMLAQFCSLAEHRLDDVGRGVREAGQVGVALDVEDVVQQELRVLDRRLVARHRLSSPDAAANRDARKCRRRHGARMKGNVARFRPRRWRCARRRTNRFAAIRRAPPRSRAFLVLQELDLVEALRPRHREFGAELGLLRRRSEHLANLGQREPEPLGLEDERQARALNGSVEPHRALPLWRQQALGFIE